MTNSPEPGHETAPAGAPVDKDRASRDDSLLPQLPNDESELIETRPDDWYHNERPPHHA